MIPFFLPVWRSALLREAILGILLAAAALHAVDLGTSDAARSEAAYDQPDGAAKDAMRPTLFPDADSPKKK